MGPVTVKCSCLKESDFIIYSGSWEDKLDFYAIVMPGSF